MVGVVILIALSLWVTSWGFRVSQDWATLQQQPTDATKKQFDASLDVVKAIVSGVGTIATIGGGVFVLWNLRLTQTRLITERFSKAVEQLGSDKIEVRLGGIYALERIAYDSDRDHWTIMEVLTSFIQEKSPIEEISEEQIRAKAYEIWQQSNGSGTDQEHWDTAIRVLGKPVTKDVQAALTVIGRRQKKDPQDKIIDLNNANLQQADLFAANLQQAYLREANLQQADLSNAKLQRAYLWEVNLQSSAGRFPAALRRSGHTVIRIFRFESRSASIPRPLAAGSVDYADLRWARLRQADLSKANLQYADLSKANLQQAELSKANLQGTNLTEAKLQRARLWQVNLQQVNLTEAKLQGAELWATKLQGAKLWDANLQGVYLRDANLQGAYLRGANLQQANLTEAKLQEGILLATDLRKATLDLTQLEGEKRPLLCNVALPEGFPDKDKLKDRDCDQMPAELHKRYPRRLSLEDAKGVVDRARQKKWE
jgi:uncharacterized protein YjbI with pentapeptide repeats